MTRVFSVRISKELFDKINSEIKELGISRREWLTSLYNSKNTQKKHVYSSVYKQKRCSTMNELHSFCDSLKPSNFKDSSISDNKEDIREILKNIKTVSGRYKKS